MGARVRRRIGDRRVMGMKQISPVHCCHGKTIRIFAAIISSMLIVPTRLATPFGREETVARCKRATSGTSSTCERLDQLVRSETYKQAWNVACNALNLSRRGRMPSHTAVLSNIAVRHWLEVNMILWREPALEHVRINDG